jgi:hypothetical protein
VKSCPIQRAPANVTGFVSRPPLSRTASCSPHHSPSSIRRRRGVPPPRLRAPYCSTGEPAFLVLLALVKHPHVASLAACLVRQSVVVKTRIPVASACRAASSEKEYTDDERMKLFENKGNAADVCDTDRQIQRAGRWIEQSSFRPDILVGHVAVANSTPTILSTSPKARFRGVAICIMYIIHQCQTAETLVLGIASAQFGKLQTFNGEIDTTCGAEGMRQTTGRRRGRRRCFFASFIISRLSRQRTICTWLPDRPPAIPV